jgi:hypothetical protein
LLLASEIADLIDCGVANQAECAAARTSWRWIRSLLTLDEVFEPTRLPNGRIGFPRRLTGKLRGYFELGRVVFGLRRVLRRSHLDWSEPFSLAEIPLLCTLTRFLALA